MIKIAAMEYFKDLPDVMRVQDVAKALRCSKNTIYDLIDSGVLKCIKLGNKKITAKSLTEFLDTYDGYDLSDL